MVTGYKDYKSSCYKDPLAPPSADLRRINLDKLQEKPQEGQLYIVHDRGGNTSKPVLADEALRIYEAWSRQGGICVLYKCVPVEVELKIKGELG